MNYVSNSAAHGSITVSDTAAAGTWGVGGLVGAVAGDTKGTLGQRRVYNSYSTTTLDVQGTTTNAAATTYKYAGALIGHLAQAIADAYTEEEKQQPSFAAQQDGVSIVGNNVTLPENQFFQCDADQKVAGTVNEVENPDLLDALNAGAEAGGHKSWTVKNGAPAPTGDVGKKYNITLNINDETYGFVDVNT